MIMGAQGLCKPLVGVRSSHPPPCKEVRSLAPLVLVVKHRFCNPRSGVRFTPGAPVFMRSFLTIKGSTFYLRGNRSDRSIFSEYSAVW